MLSLICHKPLTKLEITLRVASYTDHCPHKGPQLCRKPWKEKSPIITTKDWTASMRAKPMPTVTYLTRWCKRLTLLAVRGSLEIGSIFLMPAICIRWRQMFPFWEIWMSLRATWITLTSLKSFTRPHQWWKPSKIGILSYIIKYKTKLKPTMSTIRAL